MVAVGNATAAGPPAETGTRRRLPVIATDRCVGCGLCVEACPHACLELVWSFATLIKPEACTGEGACSAVCPEQWIRMEWATGASVRRAASPAIPCTTAKEIPDEHSSSMARTELDPLLADLLSPLRGDDDTPLQFGIDSLGIAAWALRRRQARLPVGVATRPLEPDALPRHLEASIRRALDAPRKRTCAARSASDPRTTEHALAAWLARLHEMLRGVHPRACTLLALRMEGAEPRAIAERLGLGLRLVARLFHDLRQALDREAEQ